MPLVVNDTSAKRGGLYHVAGARYATLCSHFIFLLTSQHMQATITMGVSWEVVLTRRLSKLPNLDADCSVEGEITDDECVMCDMDCILTD